MIHQLELSVITSVYQFIRKIKNHLQLFYSNKKQLLLLYIYVTNKRYIYFLMYGYYIFFYCY